MVRLHLTKGLRTELSTVLESKTRTKSQSFIQKITQLVKTDPHRINLVPLPQLVGYFSHILFVERDDIYCTKTGLLSSLSYENSQVLVSLVRYGQISYPKKFGNKTLANDKNRLSINKIDVATTTNLSGTEQEHAEALIEIDDWLISRPSFYVYHQDLKQFTQILEFIWNYNLQYAPSWKKALSVSIGDISFQELLILIIHGCPKMSLTLNLDLTQTKNYSNLVTEYNLNVASISDTYLKDHYDGRLDVIKNSISNYEVIEDNDNDWEITKNHEHSLFINTNTISDIIISLITD